MIRGRLENSFTKEGWTWRNIYGGNGGRTKSVSNSRESRNVTGKPGYKDQRGQIRDVKTKLFVNRSTVKKKYFEVIKSKRILHVSTEFKETIEKLVKWKLLRGNV